MQPIAQCCCCSLSGISLKLLINQALHNVLQENEEPRIAEQIGEGAVINDANKWSGASFQIGDVSANSSTFPT